MAILLKNMKDLENKLNKEYENIGTITIEQMHEETLEIKDIEYIDSIMAKIVPLESEEPIVVAQTYFYKKTYKVIDGYHRLKNKILKNEPIKVYILDKYSLNRKSDTLYEFIEKLVGKTIKFTSSTEFLLDDKYYEIEENQGCGGCGSGWSSIEVLPKFIDKNIKIKTVESKGGENSDLYDLYINNELVAKVDVGFGNGYYGGDFEIKIIS